MADFYELMEEMGEPGYAKKKGRPGDSRTEYRPDGSREEDRSSAAGFDIPDDSAFVCAEACMEDEEEDFQDEEYEERPRKKKKRRKKHYFLRFLIFVALVIGTVKFMQSDFFTVSEILVDGNHYYTKAQIIEMAGLKTGCNLFFDTKTAPAKSALLEDPYIRLVSVRKELPETVRIAIEERTEYAAIPYGENYILIDHEGMVLRISDREPVLPVLSGLSLVEMKPGTPLQVEQPYMLTDTLALIAEMDENDVYFKQIYFSAVVVKAYIYDDLYCEGTPENIKNSMPAIYELLTALYKKDITHGVVKVGSDGYIAYSPSFE